MSESNGNSNGRFQPGNKFGKGGPRPGSGPKPSEIRSLCASKFYRNVPILDRIARNKTSSPRDRIAAILALAKVGVPSQHEHTGEDGDPLRHVVTHTIDHEAYNRAFAEYAKRRLADNGRPTSAGNGN